MAGNKEKRQPSGNAPLVEEAASRPVVEDGNSGRSWRDALEDISQLSDASSVYSAVSEAMSDDEESVASESGNMSTGLQNQSNETAAESTYWRLNPEESHSDFTILVQRQDGIKDTYHVHKFVLSVGKCQSSYLKALFSQSGRFMENELNVSTIELMHTAADAFPIVLDFAYSRGSLCMLDTKSVSGVLHLADYLGMPVLRKRAQDFIKEDLSLENAHSYYEDAANLHLDRLVYDVEQYLITQILLVPPQARIVEFLSVSSMVEILAAECLLERKEIVLGNVSCPYLETARNASHHLSKLISAFIEKHDISVEEFGILTNKDEYLPFVDISVASELIDVQP